MSLLKFDLQLFGESTAQTAEGGANQTAPAQPSRTEDAASSGGEVKAKSQEDLRREYQTFVNSPEYKQFYGEDKENTVKERLKGSRAKIELADKFKPVADLLAERYGVAKGDYDALTSAAMGDVGNYETEAIKRGLDTETWRTKRGEFLELEEFKAKQSAEAKQAETDAQVKVWMDEAQGLNEKYPNFDINTELENERFGGLLQKGLSVEEAYVTLHHGEIMKEATEQAAKRGEELAVERIRSRGARPSEAGISTNSPPVNAKVDYSQMSEKQFNEILKKAKRGEKVDFHNLN